MVDHQFNRSVVDRAAQYLICFAIAGAFLYGMNHWWIQPMVGTDSFFRTSFNDILALIVFVPLSYFLARVLSIIPPFSPLRLWHIGLGWIVFSLLFEWLVPKILPHHTGTGGDVAAYGSGGIILWVFNRMALDFARIREGSVRVVYYDGNCGICQAAADWSSARTVSGSAFPYHPHQLIDETLRPDLAARARKTLIVHFSEGFELTHARALGALLIRMRFLWPLFGWILITPLLWPLTRPAYSLFARYRHRVSQWAGLNACVID
ncbi:MAG: DUF393 domain-containing protein [Lentisphaeria bacterium]|nr:DUF393 domain-containing protein [Candidatus Neomarinimicrobiota bacterium]MCF7841303.1 DUF393 domain-containing protein [Lentisphaeria bacterium]